MGRNEEFLARFLKGRRNKVEKDKNGLDCAVAQSKPYKSPSQNCRNNRSR